MRVWINSPLVSISASSADLKRIETLHSLFRDFGANETFPTTSWSVWVQVPVPAGHLAVTPEGYSRRQLKVLTAKPTAKLLGPCSGTAWAGWKGGHKHRVSLSWQQLLQQWQAHVLPLVWYWLSLRVKKILMVCKFQAVMSHWRQIFLEGQRVRIRFCAFIQFHVVTIYKDTRLCKS